MTVTGLGNLTTSSVYVLSGRRLGAVVAPIHAWLASNGTWLTIGLLAAVTVSALTTVRRAGRA